MRNPVSTVRSIATWLVETSRIFFAWLIEPLAKALEPYKDNRLVRSIATWLVETSRSFFAWLIEPLAKALEPYKENVVVRNIPNALSVGRCLAAVWVDWQIYQAPTERERWLYLGIIVVLIISDGIDGALARRLKLESRFGAMADPFADKILIGGLVIGLAFKFGSPLFAGLVMVLLVIELGNGLAGYKGSQLANELGEPERAGSSTWGKLKFGDECLLVLLGWTLLPSPELALAISTLLIMLVIPLAVKSLRGYIQLIKVAMVISKATNLTVV